MFDEIEKIIVSVVSKDGAINLEKQAIIRFSTPDIIIYEKSPSFGADLRRAVVGKRGISKNQATVIAVPYFFSGKRLDSSDISYAWFINDQEVDSQTKNEIPLVLPEGSGQFQLSVKAETNGKLKQGAIIRSTLNY